VPSRDQRRLTLQSRGQTTAGRSRAPLPAHSRRCLPLISNVGHHGRSPCFRASTAFARLRMKCPRPSLLLRVSPPNTWCAFPGISVRPLWRSLVATPRGLGVTSWVLSTLRFVAPVVATARLPISLLLALRAAVLRLAVSPSVHSFSSVLLLRSPTALCRAKSRLFSSEVLSSGLSSAALAHFGHRGAVSARDAQPFNREDKQRRVRLYCFCQRTAAVVCLSSQTLGITIGRHAFGSPQPSLGFE
jgi:hypothetical protein